MDTVETLSHGAVVVRAPGWDDEQPSKPSKRELLEQILAEQRKMNELLARMTGESGALVRSSVLSGAEVRILCQLDAQEAGHAETSEQAMPQ